MNCVRFAPDSSTYCSVGGSKALLYTGDGVGPTALAGHTGSVYCVSFAPGGGQLVTVRATPLPGARGASHCRGRRRLGPTKPCAYTTRIPRAR